MTRRDSADALRRIEALRDLLLRGQNPSSVVLLKLIRSIQDDQVVFDAIASRSRLHRNGFYRFILGDSGGRLLRLHVWLSGAKRPHDIHNHVGEITSLVITGRLRERRYTPTTVPRSGLALSHCRYPSWSSVDRSPQPIGAAWLVNSSERTIGSGDTYRIPISAL